MLKRVRLREQFNRSDVSRSESNAADQLKLSMA